MRIKYLLLTCFNILIKMKNLLIYIVLRNRVLNIFYYVAVMWQKSSYYLVHLSCFRV